MFFVAFLAATIIPLSSEGALGVALIYGMGTVPALFFASAGNVLGVMLNYTLGYLAAESRINRRWSGFQYKVHWFTEKYGIPSLLLSWLPVLGDPITIAAGYAKMKWPYFLFIAGSLRVLRYVALVAIIKF